MSPIKDYRPALLSASLGRAWLHDFDNKARQAAKYGFEGVEVFYEDIEYLAKKLAHKPGNDSGPPNTEELLAAAEHIRQLFDTLGLETIALQPFLFYEGLLDRVEHDRLVNEKLQIWLRLAKVLGTDIIQIPANFLPAVKLTGSIDIIVGDMVEISDLGLQQQPPIRFAYESLCWSTHVDTWEASWEVVERVNRPNFGLCLDTFNIAGRVWGDPAAPDGKTRNADADLEASLQRLGSTVGLLEKVFFIQVVDAEKMSTPLVKGHPFHVDGNPPRMNWSRNARAFMYESERGAYLPVEKVTRALIERLGYKGWVSMELFSRTMSEEGENVPEEHAKRGIAAWKKLEERLHLNGH